MSNEEQYEYYGWKANQLGFFTEWREAVALAISKDPKADRSTVGSMCYELLKKNQQESLRPQILQASWFVKVILYFCINGKWRKW